MVVYAVRCFAEQGGDVIERITLWNAATSLTALAMATEANERFCRATGGKALDDAQAVPSNILWSPANRPVEILEKLPGPISGVTIYEERHSIEISAEDTVRRVCGPGEVLALTPLEEVMEDDDAVLRGEIPDRLGRGIRTAGDDLAGGELGEGSAPGKA